MLSLEASSRLLLSFHEAQAPAFKHIRRLLWRTFLRDIERIEWLLCTDEIWVVLLQEPRFALSDFIEDLSCDVGWLQLHTTPCQVLIPNGCFFFSPDLLEEVAQVVVQLIYQFRTSALAANAEQGEWPTKAPLGYLNDLETHQIVVDPERAPIVRRMFEEYAAGSHSVSSLHEKTKDWGLRYRGSGQYCSRSNVERILKNPIYAGHFRWNGELIKGIHEPIISFDLYEQVQQLLRQGHKPKALTRFFAFKGLLTCGYCGCSITAEQKKGKYVYYRCTGFKGKCGQSYFREEVIDGMFSEIVRSIQMPAEVVSWITETLKSSHEEEKKASMTEVSKLQRRLKKLQAQIDLAYEDRLNGVISPEYWKSMNERLVREQEGITAELSRLQSLNRINLERSSEILELAQAAYSLYVRQNLQEKRKLLDTVLSNCLLKDGTLYPTYRKLFDLIVEGNKTKKWLGDRDSNPDSAVQSRVSCHWTISQFVSLIYEENRPCQVTTWGPGSDFDLKRDSGSNSQILQAPSILFFSSSASCTRNPAWIY